MNPLANIEFYNTPSGDIEVKEEGKPVFTLDMTGARSLEIINGVLEMMKTFYPEAYEGLAKEYSTKEPNPVVYNFKIASRYIRCNCGEYDATSFDIDTNGRFNFEEVKCPMRGECHLERICCKPKFNTQLSDRELEILRLIVSHHTAEEIARKFFLSPHTVNNHRRNIHIKTNTKTVAELVEFWHVNNLNNYVHRKR